MIKTALNNTIIIALKTVLKKIIIVIKKLSFLKISDPVKRDQTVKEYLELKRIFGIIYSQREPENCNYKPNLQSFIDL